MFQKRKDGLPVKKFLCYVLMFGMLFSVGFSTVGCGKKEEAKKDAKKEEAKKEEAKKGGG